MRKVLLGTAALVALVTPAVSADMRVPVYRAPPARRPGLELDRLLDAFVDVAPIMGGRR
jgi:hypothetical protein